VRVRTPGRRSGEWLDCIHDPQSPPLLNLEGSQGLGRASSHHRTSSPVFDPVPSSSVLLNVPHHDSHAASKVKGYRTTTSGATVHMSFGNIHNISE